MAALKDRIRAAAIATPVFTALLGTNPFRWYDRQLNQGSAFPAIVVEAVSGVPMYAITGRLPTRFSRYQFRIVSVNTAIGIANLEAVEVALTNFLETLNLVGIPGLCSYSNTIVMARDGFDPLPDPAYPERIIDAMIFSNDTL